MTWLCATVTHSSDALQTDSPCPVMGPWLRSRWHIIVCYSPESADLISPLIAQLTVLMLWCMGVCCRGILDRRAEPTVSTQQQQSLNG